MYRGAIRKASKKAAARFILRLFKAISKGHVYQAAGHRPHGEQRAAVTGLGCNMGLDSMIPWINKIRRTHSWACPDNLEQCMEGFKYPIVNRTLCCMQNLWMTKWLPPQRHCLFRHNLSHADCLAMKTFLLPLEVFQRFYGLL